MEGSKRGSFTPARMEDLDSEYALRFFDDAMQDALIEPQLLGNLTHNTVYYSIRLLFSFVSRTA